MSKKPISFEEAKKRYNGIMLEAGYEHNCIGTEYDWSDNPTDRERINKYGMDDIYRELEYLLYTMNESGHANYEEKENNPKWWRSVTSKTKRLMDRIKEVNYE